MMNGRGRSGADAPAYFCVVLIRGYQRLVSPLFGPGKCRFYPSCSHYAIEAVELHGVLRGLWLTVKRLVKCGPWHSGGYDPVPPVITKKGRAGHSLKR